MLRVEGLQASYGAAQALFDVSLQAGEGEFVTLMGRNGMGKTTTIRMLLGLIRPTRGEATVLGEPLRFGRIGRRAEIGYLPGDLALYDRMTGEQVLAHLASLRGGVRPERYRALAERLGLDLSRRTRDLSRGNRQKIGVVQAFMHWPRLLVLDEPTSGLDPLVQQEFQALVREAVDFGATVFLSSHVLAEVEQLADRVAIVDDGRLLVVDTVDGLRERATKRVELDFAGTPPAALAQAPGVRSMEVHGPTAVCAVAGPVGAMLPTAVAHGVLDVHTHDPDLEDAFLGYVAGGAR